MRNFTVATAFAFAIAAMFALAPAKAEDMLKSSGKCWVNYAWADCPREQSRAPKASKASVAPSRRPSAVAGTKAPTTEGSGGGGRY
jgi:hypothetical protein